jgi:predicted nucleic acid-binding protein
MILLDTNVISEFMGPAPEHQVAHWLDLQPRSSVWTTSINAYEIRSGLFAMPAGKRRIRAAELCADRRRRGRPVDVRDTMIAGIVLASRAKLATRNVKHFEDIAASVVNPWEA